MTNRDDILKKVSKTTVPAERPKSDRQKAKPERGPDTARQFAVGCARIMEDNRCEAIVVLDLRGISPICDFMVIGTGTSDRQIRAVSDFVKEYGKEQGERPFAVDGYNEASWIVVDYVDVVVHVFEAEPRAYYDLESLWGDAPSVPWGGQENV